MDQESLNPKDYRQGFRQNMSTYYWVWQELLKDPGRQAAKRFVGYMCLCTIVAMTVPFFLGRMIDALQTERAHAAGWYFAGIVVAFYGRRFLQRQESHAREIMYGENIGTIDLRTSELFYQKSLGQHLREHDILSSSAMEKGRGRAQEMISLIVTEGSEVFFLLGSAYLALWFLSPLAGIASSLVFLVYGLWSRYLNQEVAIVCVPLDDQFRKFNRYRIERWERIERVKTNGKEAEETRHLSAWWYEVLEKDRRFWLWFSDQCTLRSIVSTTLMVIVMGISVKHAWEAHAGYGKLFTLFIWLQTIVENVWRLGTFEHRLSWSLPSVQSLERALKLEPDINDAPDAQPVDTDEGVRIEFRSVTHIYHPNARQAQPDTVANPVLKNVSFTIEPGEVVALLGRSGAGKTSAMRLLQRCYDPEEGTIFINNVDLRDVELQSWLQQVGYIPQQASIFDGTLRYNLLYGLPAEERSKVSDKELWVLMRRLHIDFGERLTNGLDTQVGKNGMEVSGGEAQRIMIGAAIAKNPRFLLVDEATSALDSTTELGVQSGLAEALSGKTGALIIAHRLSSVRGCNKFIVLKKASDVGPGESQIEAIASSFEELVRISPTFRMLAKDQGVKIASREETAAMA